MLRSTTSTRQQQHQQTTDLHLVSFYTTPPTTQITLPQFETLALARLKTLRALELETIRAGSANAASIGKEVEKTMRKEKTLLRKRGVTKEEAEEERNEDNIAHWILRLAYCGSEEYRHWFLKWETALFKYRYAQEEDKKGFIAKENINYAQVHTEKIRDMQRSLIFHGSELDNDTNFDKIIFFKVPFEKCPELVARRHVYLEDGYAYVSENQLTSLVTMEFRENLDRKLVEASLHLGELGEEDRIEPLLKHLTRQDTSKKDFSDTNSKVTAQEIDGLVPLFPLCMQYTHSKLRADRHLKHGGRMQYGLFLKGIGLSLEEALLFWRKAFRDVNDDKFQKEYAYNIRHNYGREGKRTNYSPYGCNKIINTPQSVGDASGCPFRHFSAPNLTNLIRSGPPIGPSALPEILALTKEGNHTLACTRYLDSVKDQMGVKLEFEQINHPNQYFEMAQGERRNRERNYEKKEEPGPDDMEIDR